MRPSQYVQLCSVARRIMNDAGEAEDIVQEAYLAAFLAGLTDFDAIDTRKWLVGTVRNKARMALRGAVRRRGRESQWQVEESDSVADDHREIARLLDSLPSSLKSVAALALSGHSRKEITYLLNLTETALRQRIRALKCRVTEAEVVMPVELTGLTPGVAYGRIRGALLSKLAHRSGFLASHDPDGHLFVIGHSQNGTRRQ
ncbi:MAG: sigma-70 family RNA polymerase sigma factor [Saccharospirillum sp.]|nr:sigma-70 family RNA polymerase sigma factor [Saccharospirillum sp.]